MPGLIVHKKQSCCHSFQETGHSSGLLALNLNMSYPASDRINITYTCIIAAVIRKDGRIWYAGFYSDKG